MTQAADTLKIRDAQPDELDAIHDLTLRAYEEYAVKMTPSAWAGLRGVVLEALATPLPAERIVAVQNGRLVGSVMLFPPAVDAYGALSARSAVPELRLLAVPPEARGQGIGRVLVKECIERARRSGATTLGLHSSKSMETAIRLYETLGFQRSEADDFQPPGAELVMAFRLSFTG